MTEQEREHDAEDDKGRRGVQERATEPVDRHEDVGIFQVREHAAAADRGGWPESRDYVSPAVIAADPFAALTGKALRDDSAGGELRRGRSDPRRRQEASAGVDEQHFAVRAEAGAVLEQRLEVALLVSGANRQATACRGHRVLATILFRSRDRQLSRALGRCRRRPDAAPRDPPATIPELHRGRMLGISEAEERDVHAFHLEREPAAGRAFSAERLDAFEETIEAALMTLKQSHERLLPLFGDGARSHPRLFFQAFPRCLVRKPGEDDDTDDVEPDKYERETIPERKSHKAPRASAVDTAELAVPGEI